MFIIHLYSIDSCFFRSWCSIFDSKPPAAHDITRTFQSPNSCMHCLISIFSFLFQHFWNFKFRGVLCSTNNCHVLYWLQILTDNAHLHALELIEPLVTGKRPRDDYVMMSPFASVPDASCCSSLTSVILFYVLLCLGDAIMHRAKGIVLIDFLYTWILSHLCCTDSVGSLGVGIWSRCFLTT